jgi:hypothetical protein
MPLAKAAQSNAIHCHAPRIRLALLAATALLLGMGMTAEPLHAGTLTITSVPPGATVEIDGVTMGKTPYQQNFSDAYFHKPHTVLAHRLEHSMIARLSLESYQSQEIKLTEGPLVYYTMNGKTHGNYWLLASDYFQVVLKKVNGEEKPAAQTPPAKIPIAREDKTKTPDDGSSPQWIE